MSDTGGGHRAAAEAIADALQTRYGEDAVDITLVDVFRHCRWPLNKMPEFYNWIVNLSPRLWGWGYHVGNFKPFCEFNKRYIYFSNRSRLRQMVVDHPADVVVSVHSIITQPSMYAYESYGTRPPFITVVTDLVSTPRYWYDQRVDYTFVPTSAAYKSGVANGISEDQIEISGLPVHPRFNHVKDRDEVRQDLGWDSELPAILMVAGGEGMGPLYETAMAINRLGLPCQLAIIAGKNKALKERLETATWNQPTFVYGFIRDMPDKMRAADILVTKAGPATITEAFNMGLPVILSDLIPGQEYGNMRHVVDNNAGVFANSPEKVAQAVADWLHLGSEAIEERRRNAKRLAHPDAVWDIADLIWQYATETAQSAESA